MELVVLNEQTSQTGCLICGEPLDYLDAPIEMRCALCGELHPRVGARCRAGHFVCDACHRAEALPLIQRVLLRTDETDMVALLRDVRRHPAIKVHGPEHHALVPGIVVATYRNLGGEADDDMILEALRRGSEIPGGFCATTGSCGAAMGVGIGFSVILGANPLEAKLRQTVIASVSRCLSRIGQNKAARCCQRESWLALREAAEISREILPIPLKAEAELICHQHQLNRECIHKRCPLYPGRERGD